MFLCPIEDYNSCVSYDIFYETLMIYCGSRDSAVDIATGCGLDDREIGDRVPVG
jgi:hypothetical protein